jgi:segregation and condensation protein A
MPGPPEYLPSEPDAGYSHNADDILDAIIRVIGRDNIRLSSINPRKPVYPGRIMYSIREKSIEILDKMRQVGQIGFISLFDDCSSRSEVVATLIAVLELCKAGNLLVFGGKEDLTVSYKSDFDETNFEHLEVTAYG